MKHLLIVCLFLSACSSVPKNIEALQAENALLKEMLAECEADAQQCLDLLIECESLRQP